MLSKVINKNFPHKAFFFEESNIHSLFALQQKGDEYPPLIYLLLEMTEKWEVN